MKTLTREQAVAIVGLAAVEAVEAENCDFTNRVGYNGSCQGDELVEFSASVSGKDADGNVFHLRAFYYQDAADVDEHGDDLSCLDWEVYGYIVD